MAITVTGGTPKDAKRILELLQDYDAYTSEVWGEAHFNSKELADAISFFTIDESHPANLVYVYSNINQDYKAELTCDIQNLRNDDPLLHDVLYHAGTAFNFEKGDVFVNIGTALNAPNTCSNQVFREADIYADRRNNGDLHEELGEFLRFREERARSSKSAHEPA